VNAGDTIGLAGETLVDSHAHLDDPRFADDLDAVVARARADGVSRIVAAGANIPSSREALALSGRYEGVYAAVGVHPHDAKELDEAGLAELRRLAGQPKVVAIGEIGLDFHYDFSPRATQRSAFTAQLDLARDLGLPVIVHDREAHGEVLAALQAWGGTAGVLHCFSGDEAMARQAITLGFLISFAGPLTFAKSTRLHQLAAALPLNSLLVETDCPYLTPEPFRGRRNEPARVRLVAEKLAALRGLSAARVAGATTANAARLFKFD
jgi:TatD DNase family protein